MSEEKSAWTITDDDCLQCCRKAPELGPNVFELAQINSYDASISGTPFYQVAHGYIYLDDYSQEENLEALACYGYGDYEGFLAAYPGATVDDLDQLLSEMFFEMENQEYVFHEAPTWNDAVNQIAKITDLELSEYRKPDKPLTVGGEKGKLNDMIHIAEQTAAQLGRKEVGRQELGR